jgi:serine/threonine-protein kinase
VIAKIEDSPWQALSFPLTTFREKQQKRPQTICSEFRQTAPIYKGFHDMSNPSNNIFKTGYVLDDKWVIIEFVGKGAMGEVYRAHQLNLKRDVAIKVISQEMLQSFEDDPEEIETAIQRFRREVQAMAQVRHPNVLQIFDYGSDVLTKDGKDVPIEYITMEFIPGATLRFTMSEEGFDPEHDLIASWLIDYFLPLLEGVEAIHDQDIVHRDLKPENVLIDGATPKIADFGLACSIRMAPVTQSVDVKGTPAYMSPEHFFDFKKANQQSDIYSLGKILYEAIDGQITSKLLPFKSAALSNPDTPFTKKLDQIIQKATSEKKEERLKSIGDLRSALLEAIDILKRETTPDVDETPDHLPLLHRPGFIWAGIVIAIISVGLMGLWHLIGSPAKKTVTLQNQQIAQVGHPPQSPSAPSKTESASPARSILGKDGIPMHFIPGGEFRVGKKGSDGQVQAVQVLPFYLDEKIVTNHHFAEFLNAVKGSLIIENGVVKSNNEIWIYLGEGVDPHEQIIYEHGRFHLREIEYAAHPVVRVTWYGAAAYARHYGKRLISEHEWDYLITNNNFRNILMADNKVYMSPSDSQKGPLESEAHTRMMQMHMATDSKQSDVSPPSGQNSTHDPSAPYSSDSLSGRKSTRKDFKEWVARGDANIEYKDDAGSKGIISHPSLVTDLSPDPGPESKTFRYPWEAFPDVGFRCALSLNNTS